MRVEYDHKKNEFDVFVSKDEVMKAFKSKKDYLSFLKQIFIRTYGEEMAEIIFPEEISKIILSEDEGETDEIISCM